MKNDDGKAVEFFDILIKKEVYFGLIYTLVSIPIALIYFVFTLSGLLIGFALIPIWIGIPFLNGFLKLVWELSKLEEKTFETFTKVSLPKISKFLPLERNAYLNFKAYLKNKRTWNRISYFLLKIFWRILFAIPAAALIGLSSLLIYTPINSVFGRINIYSFYQTDSFIEVILIFFICILIWVGLLHFIKYLIHISSRLLKHFFCR